MPDQKREVSLPQGQQPFVHPGVPNAAQDQAAAFAAARAARQSKSALPKTTTPVAGGQAPPIPHLAGAPQQPGMTMAQHAVAERQVAAQPVPGQQPTSVGFVQPAPAAMQAGPNIATASPAQLGILPADELPQAATEDPMFQHGTGSMFAASQPHLAQKYGVIRRGQHIPPQQLLQPKPGQQAQLRPETVRDLEELTNLQNRQVQSAQPTMPSSEGGAAAGNVGAPEEKPMTAEERAELRKSIEDLDNFDFDKLRQQAMVNPINNLEQRKIIEERLEPMDVGDMVTQGYVIQKVPIIPGKFFAEYKTTDGETDLAIKRLIMEESNSIEMSDRYFMDKFGIMSLAAALHKVNNKPLGDVVDSEGNFNDDLFLAKFRKVVKLPMPMLASLGTNAQWFDERVRQLFVAEKLGNG